MPFVRPGFNSANLYHVLRTSQKRFCQIPWRPVRAAVDLLLRIDCLFEAGTIAHEVVFEMHRELAIEGRDDSESRALLERSGRIALLEMPSLASELFRLERRWRDKRILDPDAAEATASALVREAARVEPRLRELLERQRGIAARMDELLYR
jgi:hypothetical protein